MGKKENQKKPRLCESSESSSDSSHCSTSDKYEKCLEEMYDDMKMKLLQDETLQVGGCDAYGSFYTLVEQLVPPAVALRFDISQNVLNVDICNDKKNIYVRRDGVYYIILHITPDQASQWTLFVNGVPNFERTFGTFNSSGQLTCTHLIKLRKDDNICVRNFVSSSTAVQIPLIVGGTDPGANLEIVIRKIAPYEQYEEIENCKLNYKLKKKFNKLLKLLLNDPQIMIKGIDAYGSFYSTNTQIVPIDNSIIFDYNQNVLNMTHTKGTGDVKILKDGIYYFCVILETSQSCQFTLFVNGVQENSTTTGINKGASVLQMRQMIELKTNDIVSIRNHVSSSGAVTITQGSGGSLLGVNTQLILLRVSPLQKVQKVVEQKSALQLEKDCIYKKFKYYLLKHHKLDFDGNNTYFILNASASQTLNLQDPVTWNYSGPLKNVYFKPGTNMIKVHKDGVYKLIFDLEAYQPSQFTIFVNNVVVPSTIAGTDSGSGQISIRQLLELKKNDILSVKNHSSFINPVISISNPGGNNPSNNAIFSAYRLGPIPYKLKPPCDKKK
jgi:hypothetical protein